MHSLVERAERRLAEELRREQESNRHFARRCPGVPETECYRRGPLPASRFYTVGDYQRYLIDREQARFNPGYCARVRSTKRWP